MITDKEMYEGFSKEEVERNRAEVIERWGEDELLESENRIRQMSKQQWSDVKQAGIDNAKKLAGLMHLAPEDLQVQQAIQEHYNYISHFSDVSAERYLGLGRLYVEDERFTAYYNKHATGLAAFMQKAIEVFCNNGMRVKG